MSDEPTKKDDGAEWVMPEPVFRSTEGQTPKPVQRGIDPDEVDTESPDAYDTDDVDTLSPDFTEADTETPNANEIDTETPDISDLTTEAFNLDDEIPDEELPEEVSSDAPTDPSIKPGKSGGGCMKSMLTIVGLIALFTIAVVIALIYFLFYSRPVETGTF